MKSCVRLRSRRKASMALQLASIPESITNIKLVIQASAPQSNVFTRAYSKAAYDAKNGAPMTAAPKVFFKWFYVKTATGEK